MSTGGRSVWDAINWRAGWAIGRVGDCYGRGWVMEELIFNWFSTDFGGVLIIARKRRFLSGYCEGWGKALICVVPFAPPSPKWTIPQLLHNKFNSFKLRENARIVIRNLALILCNFFLWNSCDFSQARENSTLSGGDDVRVRATKRTTSKRTLYILNQIKFFFNAWPTKQVKDVYK